MATLEQLLHPQVIFESITSRIKKPGDTLQRFFGMQIGGGNFERIRGRVGSYDIFDNVRAAATGRAPNTGPATVAAQAVHQQPVTAARFHEKVPLYYDRIFPLRVLGKPSSVIDPGGADYITRQEGIIKQRFQNAREFLVAGMMRGSAQFLISGEEWLPVFTGGTITIDQQVPAGNKGQLNMLGTGAIIGTTWADTTNATVFEDVLKVNAAFWQLHGWPLKHIWVNSVVWSLVTNNAGIKARAGTANVVFEVFQRVPGAEDKEAARDEFIGILRPLPDIMWHIYDGGLELNGTFTKFFHDKLAVFMPEPDPAWATMITGTEYVVENEMGPAIEREGPYFWPQYVREPGRIEIVGLDLSMAVLRVPKAVAIGDVVFP